MLEVSVVNAHGRHRLRKKAIVGYVQGVLRGERRRQAEIGVVFIDARKSRTLNRTFLGHDRSTDVISFPLGEGENLEGEIYVNLDKAREQARTYKVSFAEEVARLVVHGTLHLVGYDDDDAQEAKKMKIREDMYVHGMFGNT